MVGIDVTQAREEPRRFHLLPGSQKARGEERDEAGGQRVHRAAAHGVAALARGPAPRHRHAELAQDSPSRSRAVERVGTEVELEPALRLRSRAAADRRRLVDQYDAAARAGQVG
jgi:hypothetical protein